MKQYFLKYSVGEMMNLKCKKVIIIGGGSGIGFETARLFIQLGIDGIVLAGRNKEKLLNAKEKLISGLDSKTKIEICQFDITDIGGHIDFINECRDLFGNEPDGVIISSGMNADSGGWKGWNVSEELYDKVMDTNLKGPFFFIRNFSNYIEEIGARANICVVSSISAHRDLLGAYQFSKNILSGIVSSYGKYLTEKGIILNCVEPGTTDTDMMPHLKSYTDGKREGNQWKDNGIGRVIRPEEIAETIAFLMSENSEILAGTCLLAGGGCKSIYRGN